MATNVRAPMALLRRAFPMLEESKGVVFNTSSIASVLGFPGLGVYGASKAALDAVSRNAAADVAAQGIRGESPCLCQCAQSLNTSSILHSVQHQPLLVCIRDGRPKCTALLPEPGRRREGVSGCICCHDQPVQDCGGRGRPCSIIARVD